MSEPNDALRAARESVESPSSPGQPLTREELAEAVNAQVFRSTGKVTAIDANHIGKWERGVIRWPAAHYRAAIRAVLDVATDADLGFRRGGSGCTTEDVDRKTFLRSTLGLGAGAALARATPAVAALAGGQDDLVSAVAGPTQDYRRMESSVSSQYLAPAAEGHLRLAKQVVHEKVRSSKGFSTLSEIAGLAAWLAADRGDSATARARYKESIRYAESSRNSLLVSYMTASLGHYAVEMGDPRQGLHLLDRAAQYQDGHTPAAARAWLASLRAVAFGAMGDRAQTLDALRTAQRNTDRQTSDAQWPWVFAFTSAKAARYQSTALAALGDYSGSRAAYTAAIPTITAPKPLALAKVEFADLMVSMRQEDEACRLAVEALQVGKQYGSEKIVERVRDLRSRMGTMCRDAKLLDRMLIDLYD
ncbi:hypothetical protein [Saccharopolyspora elongata]|uniref:Transcriptional regulator n=1 Tax=Saccharopolyspora elongata TaxID=2530387 RepID=A0A4R4YXG3_9PSEU|nr:hypothetical protein [Saccharopolyspora elongata]TDD50113.1 hypothetical protein E1288_18040 [Saccharopolyspora elongata]